MDIYCLFVCKLGNIGFFVNQDFLVSEEIIFQIKNLFLYWRKPVQSLSINEADKGQIKMPLSTDLSFYPSPKPLAQIGIAVVNVLFVFRILSVHLVET